MIRLDIQTDIKDGALEIIKTAIAAEIKRLEIGLHKTIRKIETFESKYKVSAAAFSKGFAAEDLEHGDMEYVEWAGELKIRDRIAADLQKLRDIEYVAH